MNIDKTLIPYTGGRYYDYITEEEFAEKWENKDLYTIDHLRTGCSYTFYRIAKNFRDEIVYMKITGTLIHIDEEQMIFTGYHDTKAKVMLLGGYKEHWFFDVVSFPEEKLN